jgi:hypothetical protein
MRGTQVRRLTVATAALVALALVGTGCSQKYTAERDGKKFGQAVCDIRTASSSEDRDKAVTDAKKQLEDLGNKYAMFTAEDRKDIQNNLADLAEHSVQGNDTLIEQDIAVLQRSVKNIREDLDETSKAAWDGFLEGLSDCTTA